MDWVSALAAARERREPAVLVTVSDVRGHAPREIGAAMVVTADAAWGSIGGGNLEEVALRRARSLIADGATAAVVHRSQLSDRGPAEHGVQCCGGEVTVLLQPMPVRPAIAIFGLGHVGLELALVLARHEVELHLVDSRAEAVDDARLAALREGPAVVHVHRMALLPELAVASLPRGTRALVMTHDHAEDLALLDALLRHDAATPGAIGSIGVIGSRAKWVRFRARLGELGHDAAALDRVRTPIGDPDRTGLHGKQPAVIALNVAVELLAGVGQRRHHGAR